jgi:DNA-binding HxlR family transcriptional regulator
MPETHFVNWLEVAAVVEILSLKWVLPALALLNNGALRHSQLTRALRIDGKQLSRILRRLQEKHVVLRDVDGSQRPVQVRYHLTPAGRELVAILADLGSWHPRGTAEAARAPSDADPSIPRSRSPF